MTFSHERHIKNLQVSLAVLTYCLKEKENTNKKEAANSQAVPLTALRNTNPFIFLPSLGVACQGLMIYLNGGIFIGLEY